MAVDVGRSRAALMAGGRERKQRREKMEGQGRGGSWLERKEGTREGGRKIKREEGRKKGREGGREREREGGRGGGGREGGREGSREGEREGGERDKERKRSGEGTHGDIMLKVIAILLNMGSKYARLV